jgi:hypothetical protein
MTIQEECRITAKKKTRPPKERSSPAETEKSRQPRRWIMLYGALNNQDVN